MDWVISFNTVVIMELTTRRYWWAFLLSFFNQMLWTWFIFSSERWGLLPLNIVMYVMSARAAIYWYHLASEEQAAHGQRVGGDADGGQGDRL